MRQGHVHMVQRGDQCGAALVGRLRERGQGLLRTRRVKRGQRLVHQQQTGLRSQRPRQTHPLALAAREPVYPVEQFVGHVKMRQRGLGQPDAGGIDQAAHAGPQAFVRQAPRQHRRHHTLPGWQRRHLGRQKKATAQALQCAARQCPGVDAIELQAALVGPLCAGQQLQQRGLARARRADHRHLLALRHHQIQAAQRCGCTGACGRVAHGGVVQLNFHGQIRLQRLLQKRKQLLK